MVRAIVGTLLEVGRGKLTVDGFRQVIEAKDRGRAGTSAPGYALYLVDVTYPEELFSWQSAVDCCVFRSKNIIQKLSTFNCYVARISLHLRLPFRLL